MDSFISKSRTSKQLKIAKPNSGILLFMKNGRSWGQAS
jgi:hypothetical protein